MPEPGVPGVPDVPGKTATGRAGEPEGFPATPPQAGLPPVPLRRRLPGLIAAFLLLLCAGVGGYLFSEGQGTRAVRDDARHRLELLAAAMDSEINRVTHIPGTLALYGDILELLRLPPSQRAARQASVNVYLERLSAQHVDSLALFVMDTTGRVVASSDWILTDNLLGADLSHRPFFQAAKNGAPYRQYAEDLIHNEPGYFFAQPIRDERQDWRIVGVAVLMVSIRGVQRHWLANEAPAMLVDGNGLVLLAAPPEWRYFSLQPMPGEAVNELARQQFAQREGGAETLGIDLQQAAQGQVVRFSGRAAQALGGEAAQQRYLVLSRNVPGTGWHLLVLSSLRPVQAQALAHGALAAAATGCLLLWALYLSQRRRALQARLKTQVLLEAANRDLEAKVLERTVDLTRTVATLEAEVVERLSAERTLRAAQDELVQAAKLAVLGQMATGITHELTQPLGAIRTLSGNAVRFMERGDLDTVKSNLEIIGKLTEQMGSIITPLKNFARKSPAVLRPVDVSHAVGNALFLLEQRLRRDGVILHNLCRPGEAIAQCDQNRLEQVLINLLGNALDAMSDCEQRELTIAARNNETANETARIELSVADSGPGLTPDALARLFEPFYTTKPEGVGLGLGLAISRDIVREFGGELRVRMGEPGDGGDAARGAVFIVELPPAHPA